MIHSPTSLADGMDADEVLYDSPGTRVLRQSSASTGDSLICKECSGPEGGQRLRHEKALLSRLAGIAGISRLAVQSQGGNVLVLEDCHGVTLGQRLREGRFSTSAVLALASQLARTLAEVHRAGVIHRDINPANILLTPGDDAVLIDFDLGMLAEQPVAVTHRAQMVGTLTYLAPEQTGRTGHAVDQRADLYALGATLYEMAAGRPPFESDDTLRLVHAHLVREPVSPTQLDASVPAGLSAIILRLLAKSPEQRYQSAEGLLHDLSRLRDELARGRDGLFDLGERDFPARLAAPARLIGRDAELAQLIAALHDAATSPRHTVLVEGPAGVGKSALIGEFRSAMPASAGWFVQGKFDQFQKDEATADALTQALRQLGRLLLALPAAQLAAQRLRILQALGANACLATRLPEFALLLGAQAAAPDVDPRQAELLMQQMTADLIGAIATPDWPLVILLDDLQWAGAASLRGFERLMNEAGLRGFLLIGACRPGEAEAGHALMPMLARWRAAPQPPAHVSLGNLAAPGLAELAGQMLRLPPGPARALADAVCTMTGGNPFDTVELINALRRDGVLQLRESGWQWDDDQIRHFIGRGNVVDLLAARINRVPAVTRVLMEFMSCIGNTVDIRLLGAAVGLGNDALREQLQAALDDGLLVADPTGPEPGTGSVRFRHDRVQQAMLATMDDARRGERQLVMARRLSATPAFEAEAARHYLACSGMLDDAGEQRRAARLLHDLAGTLASSATWLLAERYLAAAATLLAAVGEPSDSAWRRAIDVERHSALYGLGKVGEADPLFDTIQAGTTDPLDLVEPACLQMKSYDMRGRMAEGMALGRSLLAQLGLQVPPHYQDPRTTARLDALRDWIAQEGRLDAATRPQLRDPRLLGTAKLLARMVGSAFHARDRSAYTWLLLESQRLWVEHGPCADLVATLGNLPGRLIGHNQDFRTAYGIACHLIAVGEALGFEVRTATAKFLHSGRTSPWFEPLEDSHQQAVRAHETIHTRSDPSFACYAHTHVFNMLLDLGPTIAAWEAQIEHGLALCERAGNQHAAAMHRCEQQFARALSGQTISPDSFDDAVFNEQAFLAGTANLTFVHFHLFRAMQALLWGNASALARFAPMAGAHGAGSTYGFMRSMHNQLCQAMAHAWVLQQGDPTSPEFAQDVAGLEACRHWIAQRAADQPHNFGHLLLWVEAEQAWALGDLWMAAARFDAAVLKVEARQRPWQRAVIVERAGGFHLSRGLAGSGRELMARAHAHYKAWGAIAKVEQMLRDYPWLRAPARHQDDLREGVTVRSSKGSVSVSSDALDLVGVLRASQALSSETGLEQVAARVTEVLASLCGATRVLVLWHNDGQWWLLSPAPAGPAMALAEAAARGLLPLAVFAYAERTGETLVVDDAPHDTRFARDAYFAGVPVCSLLAVPITGQGGARAMLLVENRLSRAAFNAQRLDAVMLIAGQLAVSLANAQLYDSLDQRVQARTRELEETQAKLVTTARRAGMAEIANNVLHNIGNVLNSINVSASVLRGTIGNSRLNGLARAVGLINGHAHDLRAFMETDERGKALLPYLNQLVEALGAEQQAALADLDRLSQSVEHITYVVATQQAHAGPSSVLEMVQPQDMVEEALRLAAETIERLGIMVERRYDDVPATALDKQRLVQILVNLIGNATQAMEGLPAPVRRLTLATAISLGDGGERLRISVQDHGEGIAADNLTRIFAHGFTTRENGHGFGLHSSVLAATEMGGTLTVDSGGLGLGATFTIDIPVRLWAPQGR